MILFRSIKRVKSLAFTFSSKKYPVMSAAEIDLLNTNKFPLVDVLKEEIIKSGPMPFDTYMHNCLLHPEFGYYVKNEVFNKEGDFITSPEISQLFGEMIGLWIFTFLQNNNLSEKGLRIVEFGPGTGSLMSDLLRTAAQLNHLQGLEVSFVENSKQMRKLQQEKIISTMTFNSEKSKSTEIEEFYSEKKELGIKFKWYKTYEEYMSFNFGNLSLSISKEEKKKPIIFLAHEFFDALPIKIFQFSSTYGWCEKLVCQSSSPGRNFDFILSNGPNEAVKEYLKPNDTFQGVKIEDGDTYEISPKSIKLAGSFGQILSSNLGAALIMDYGEYQGFSNSGIYKHKYVPQKKILDLPGEMDLSAYVNFMAIDKIASQYDSDSIPQGFFLEAMGINMLKKNTSEKIKADLQSKVDRIVKAEEMGEIYKFMYIGNKVHGCRIFLMKGMAYPFNYDEENNEFT